MITSHTLGVLEFQRVLERFADRAESRPGRDRILALRPIADPLALTRARDLSREALELQLTTAGFPSVAHDDLREILEKVQAEGVALDPEDLLRVARTLRVVRETKIALERSEHTGPQLRDWAATLTPARDLETRITHAIGAGGEILDDASPKLAKLRRQGLSLREGIRARLTNLLKELDLSEGEDYVTFRGGRYVIPVPSRERTKTRGIIHDQSASGQTVFVEPFTIVEENNALSRCEAEARAEERRILLELSARVHDQQPTMAVSVATLEVLDATRATAVLGAELGMLVPDVEEGGALRLVRARHPLLLAAARDRTQVIPLDFELPRDRRMLILTGPNMGGKTVALKTVGLVAVMAISGLPVPIEPGSTIPFFRSVCADIGDEQSISENLSTFASHLKHLAEFLGGQEDPKLVLLDELGTGTDPSEGGALSRAYLEALAGPETWIVATTHLGSLKDFAAEHPAAVNGSMSFDDSTLEPRFTLEVGVPGRSRAFDVASRLRFPERVLERARELVSHEERTMDKLLAEVERAKEEARVAGARARELEASAEEALRQAREREVRAQDLARRARAEAAEEAERLLREADAMVRETRRKLVETPAANASEVEATGRAVREKQREVVAQRPPAAPAIDGDLVPVRADDVTAGMDLWSIDLGTVVRTAGTPDPRGIVHVLLGGFRLDVPLERLRLVPAGRMRAPADLSGQRSGGVVTHVAAQEAVSTELDLRGMSGEEAVDTLEQYIDRALLAGLGVVRIIHGKGTGVLRQRVGEVLAKHFAVVQSRFGEPAEGGDGVTIVHLADR